MRDLAESHMDLIVDYKDFYIIETIDPDPVLERIFKRVEIRGRNQRYYPFCRRPNPAAPFDESINLCIDSKMSTKHILKSDNSWHVSEIDSTLYVVTKALDFFHAISPFQPLLEAVILKFTEVGLFHHRSKNITRYRKAHGWDESDFVNSSEDGKISFQK